MIYIHHKTDYKPKTQKKRWLSPTAINAYLRCPRSFYLSKIAKLKQKPSIHLIRGIAVHSAINKFFELNLNRCGSLDNADLQEKVKDLLRDEWQDQEKSLLELKFEDSDLDFYLTESCQMMTNFLHDFVQDNGFDKPDPTTEKMLFSKKFMTLGRIDAIHQGPPLLVDYKTCKSKEMKDEYKRQMAVYAMLYQENYGVKPTVAIHFLKFKDGLEKYKISDSYIDEIKDTILDIHAKTQSVNIEDYPCRCGWCDKNFATKNKTLEAVNA